MLNQIKNLFKKLLPSGRAFKIPYLGAFSKLINALSTVFAQAWADMNATMDVVLPDNDNFTAQDAELLERAYGLITNSTVPLADRKAAILRKINHPGTVKARQNWRYVQAQLQAAGFNVYVHENKFASSPPGTFISLSPNEVFGGTVESMTYFDSTEAIQFGGNGVQFGSYGFPKVVDYLEAEKDEFFLVPVGSSQRNTFYIGAQTFPNYADVPAAREKEFRQLICRLMPKHSVAYLLITYI